MHLTVVINSCALSPEILTTALNSVCLHITDKETNFTEIKEPAPSHTANPGNPSPTNTNEMSI
jgi:hypothetical protein